MDGDSLAQISRLASFICGIGCLYIILSSLFIVIQYHIVPLYWDEWELGKFFTSHPSWVDYLLQVLAPQNEHVIAPTKILFFADNYLFSLTNLPLVFVFAILTFITSFLYVTLVYYRCEMSSGKRMAFGVFSAAGLSLVQYENLLWGFQSQFEFVLIGALTSIILALALTEIDSKRSNVELIFLCISIGFCVFAMGSGVAIPVPIFFILFLRGASRKELAIVTATCISCLTIFGYLTRYAVAIGDTALKTPTNIAKFFVTMIGSPLTADVGVAAPLGFLLFLSLSALFAYFVVWPLLKSRPVDPGLIGLFAFAGFLFASAAGAAWGRTSLGVPAAMASRYATPMLLLWLMPLAIAIRAWLTSTRPKSSQLAGIQVCLLAALALVTWTDMRPSVAADLFKFVQPLRQAAYFVASGADDSRVAPFYPNPSSIREPIAFMRAHHLNMFARRFGLDRPAAEAFDLQMNVRPTTACTAAAVDKVTQFGDNSWAVTGWATDATLTTPKWIMAIDATGRLVGYTPPMVPRSDVAQAIGAEGHFQGFEAPVHLKERSETSVSLIAANKDGALCVIKELGALPRGLLPLAPRNLTPIQAKLSQDGAVGHPGIPVGLNLGVPYKDAHVVGTWATSDADMGTITLDVADPQCHGLYLPVVRGPSSREQTLTVFYADGESEIASLDALQPHLWALFKIGPSPHCKTATSNGVKIVLHDGGSAWGQWSALAMPGLPH